MQNYIQIENDNILKIGIKDSNGTPTGEYLEFDLEDIELPIKLNQCVIEHTKNLNYLRSQVTIIEKRPDKEINGIFTANEKAKLSLLKDFYKREMSALDLFLGKDGTKKVLNGRKPYYSMYDDISKMLEPILPLISQTADNIIAKIKNKYSSKEEGNVLE